MADNNDSGGSFTLGFILGGVIGALAATLLMPKTGSETRSDLAEGSQSWRTRADEMAAGMRERVGPTVESAKEKIAPAVESVRERVGPAVEQVSARIRGAQDGAEVNGQDMKTQDETTKEQA